MCEDGDKEMQRIFGGMLQLLTEISGLESFEKPRSRSPVRARFCVDPHFNILLCYKRFSFNPKRTVTSVPA
jgi:hypothetical protein